MWYHGRSRGKDSMGLPVSGNGIHWERGRLHIGDHVLIHASRDVKAGEELTYFNVLQPFNSNRMEMAKQGAFNCNCRWCKFETEGCNTREIKEVKMTLGKGLDMGCVVYILEEVLERWMVRGT